MREILFRGKKPITENWVYGTGLLFDGINTWVVGNSSHKPIAFGEEHYCVIPETVGQFTGLTDKNGTKIFEGDYDIDEDGDYFVYVVEFRDGAFCFVSYSQQGMLMPYGYDETAGGFGECDCLPMTDYNIETFEIRGNIHDNPKILVEEIGCDPDYFTESEEG